MKAIWLSLTRSSLCVLLKVGIGVYIYMVTAMGFLKQNPREFTIITNTRNSDHTHKDVRDQIDQLIY